MDAQSLQTAAGIADKVYPTIPSSIVETTTSPSAAETSFTELVQQSSNLLIELRTELHTVKQESIVAAASRRDRDFYRLFGINLIK